MPEEIRWFGSEEFSKPILKDDVALKKIRGRMFGREEKEQENMVVPNRAPEQPLL